MNPVITVMLLSSMFPPMSPVKGVFTIVNTSPVCGGNVVLQTAITSQNGTVLTRFGKVFHYTMSEVSSGRVSGEFEVPFNQTVPGTYVLRATVQYCGVEKTVEIPFRVCGVSLEKYTMDVSRSSLTFYLTFKNDCGRKHLVTIRETVSEASGYSTAFVDFAYVYPNSSTTIPVSLNLTKFTGAVNVTLEYLYMGRTYRVTSQLVPVSTAGTDEKPINTSLAPVVILLIVIVAVLTRSPEG